MVRQTLLQLLNLKGNNKLDTSVGTSLPFKEFSAYRKERAKLSHNATINQAKKEKQVGDTWLESGDKTSNPEKAFALSFSVRRKPSPSFFGAVEWQLFYLPLLKCSWKLRDNIIVCTHT